MPTVSEILASGNPVQVDLLTALPDGNDPATWQVCSWASYASQMVTPTIKSNTADGSIFEIVAAFIVALGQQQNVLAFGVSYQGIGIAVGPVNVPLAALGLFPTFKAWITCYPYFP